MLNFSIGQGENTQTLINMMKFYEGLASDGTGRSTPYIVQAVDGRSRSTWDSPRPSSAGLRHALIAVVERGTAAASRRQRPRRGRQDRHRAELRTARTTAGSSGLRRPTSPSSSSARSWSSREHGTTVAPYVVRTLRPLLLGPDTVGTIKIKCLIDETRARRTPRRDRWSSIPTPPRRREASGGLAHDRGDSLPVRSAVKAAVDRQLLLVSAAAASLFGLLTLYSAGQTDVPTTRRGVWIRQFVWVGRRRSVAGVSSSSSRRPGCWSGWRRALRLRASCCWCWCCWSAPARARPRAARAGSAIGGHADRPAVRVRQGGHGADAGALSLEPAGAAATRCATCWARASSSACRSSWCSSSPTWAARSCSWGSCSPCSSGPGSGRGSCSCSPRRG